MADEAASQVETSATDAEAAKNSRRQRTVSTITFPYLDLDDGVEVVRAIHNNAGKGCTVDQLAGYMKQTVTSGAFKEKVRTARIFGLIEGNIRLSPVGLLIVDPQRERTGRAQAFLKVPLYAAIYEKYKGAMLPPDVALEREMVALGVAEKQKAKARQAFQRSAEQAGFYEQGKERLVLPSGVGAATPSFGPPSARKPEQNGGRGTGYLPPTGLPAKIKMLLRVLPQEGEPWGEDEQDAWLDSMRQAVRESYGQGIAADPEEVP